MTIAPEMIEAGKLVVHRTEARLYVDEQDLAAIYLAMREKDETYAGLIEALGRAHRMLLVAVGRMPAVDEIKAAVIKAQPFAESNFTPQVQLIPDFTPKDQNSHQPILTHCTACGKPLRECRGHKPDELFENEEDTK